MNQHDSSDRVHETSPEGIPDDVETIEQPAVSDIGGFKERLSSLRSVAVVSLFSVVQLGLQFVLQIVLAKLFGTSAEMEAYLACMTFPVVISGMIIGPLGYVLVPSFTTRMEQDGPDVAWSLAGQMATWMTFITIAVTLAGWLLTRPLILFLDHGYEGEQLQLAFSLHAILIWLIPLNCWTGFLNAVHHCRGSFFLPAFSGVVGTAVTVAVVLWRQDSEGVYVVAESVVLGAIVGVLLQSAVIRQLRPGFRLGTAARTCLRLMVPLLVGAIYFRLDPLIDRYLVSPLAVGSYAYLGYAWRIVTALQVVSMGGLSIVAFPAISKHSALGNIDHLQQEVAYAIRFLATITVPIVAGVVFFGQFAIRELFQRGEFTAADTQIVAEVLAIYSGALVAAGLGDLLTKVFFALHNTKTPTVLGIVGFTVGLAAKIILSRTSGVPGIAAATSGYMLLNSLMMILILSRWYNLRLTTGLPTTLRNSAIATTAALAAAYIVSMSAIPYPLLPSVLAAVASYGLALLVMRDEFGMRAMSAARRMQSGG